MSTTVNEYIDWLSDNLINPEENEQLKDKEQLNKNETIMANSTNS